MSGKKRGNGEGTVYKRPDGRWCAQWIDGVDPYTFRPIRGTAYGATRAEAVAKMNERRAERSQPGTAITLRAAGEMWLASVKSRLDPVTHDKYGRDLRPVYKRLGAAKVKEITAADVLALYAWMEAEGLSRAAQQRAGKRVRQIFRSLQALGLATVNPASLVPLPAAPPPDVRAATAEEVARLLEAARGDRFEALYWLAVDSGARAGEMLALTVQDVNLDTGEVVISKSLQQHNGQYRVKQTKTPKGRRRVQITPQTVEQLRRQVAGKARGDLVWTGAHGRWVHYSFFYENHWRPLTRRAGLEKLRFHDLRHTCATLLLLQNVHPKIVSERLGHSSIEITLNTYSHLLPTMQFTATGALSSLLPQIPPA